MKQTREQKHLTILLSSLFLGYVMVYIDKLSVGISIVSISKDIPMTDTTKGLILSAFFIGYALMQIPMSFAINKFGAKKVIIWSVIMIGFFDLMFSFSRSIEMLIAIRLLTGMLAHSGYASSSSKEIIDNFPMNRRTFAKGVLISSSGIAGVLGPIFLSPIIEKSGWQAAYILLTIISLVIAVIIAFGIPTNNRTKADRMLEPKASLNVIWKNRNIWVLFFAAFFVNSLLYGVTNWLPTFLTSQRGLTLTEAGMISSAVGLFSLLGALGGSYVVGRFFPSKDKQVIVASSIIGGIIIFFSYFVNGIPAFTVTLGLATLCLTIAFVVLMTIPLKVFSGSVFAPSYSTISTGGILGGATAQVIIGLLVQQSGTYLTAFAYFLALGLLTGMSLLFIKRD